MESNWKPRADSSASSTLERVWVSCLPAAPADPKAAVTVAVAAPGDPEGQGQGACMCPELAGSWVCRLCPAEQLAAPTAPVHPPSACLPVWIPWER